MARYSNHGSIDDLIGAVEDRIQELGGVNSATNTTNISAAPVMGAEADDSYLEELISRVKQDLYLNDDQAHFEFSNENIYLTVFNGDQTVDEFTIPYADLSFDVDTIDDDVDYIVSNIGPDLGVG